MNGRDRDVPVVVGAGWLGQALARRWGGAAVSRRDFQPGAIEQRCAVVVASGRAVVSGGDGLAAPLKAELAHLRAVLDACEQAEARRVVVLGSADVAGLAESVTGTTPQSPQTAYARVKAALEDECVLRHGRGLPVTTVRLAPVHGPGKARTRSLVRMAARPVVAVPGGGRQSVGFVFLDDALAAVEWLAGDPGPHAAVVSVGAGPTPLRDLLVALGQAQGRSPRLVPVPVPAGLVRRLAASPVLDPAHRLLRLALPRSVSMEPPVPVTPLAGAAAMLVAAC